MLADARPCCLVKQTKGYYSWEMTGLDAYVGSIWWFAFRSLKTQGRRDDLFAHVPHIGWAPSHFFFRVRQSSQARDAFRERVSRVSSAAGRLGLVVEGASDILSLSAGLVVNEEDEKTNWDGFGVRLMGVAES